MLWWRCRRLILDDIIPSEIKFLSVTENFDITSSRGWAMPGVLSIFNAAHRKDCQQLNQDALALRTEQVYTLGYPPFGWLFESPGEKEADRCNG